MFVLVLLFSLLYTGECSHSIEHAFGISGKFERREVNEKGTALLSKDSVLKLLQEDGLYRIRIQTADGYVSSAIKACELYKSGFKEDVLLQSNENSDVVMGLDYSAVQGALGATRDCKKPRLPERIELSTQIRTAVPEKAMSIPIQTVASGPPPELQALAQTAQKGGKGAGEAETYPMGKSFFQKYWYLVFFVALYFTLTSPEIATPAAGQGQTQGAAPAAPAPAGGGGGGAKGPKRRK